MCYNFAMDEVPKKQVKKQNYEWLKPTQFKPGQSGNPKGRPPGKSLKTYVREYFESLPDEDKMAFLNQIDPKTAWEMAEGRPESTAKVDAKVEHSISEETKQMIEKALEDL